MESKFVKSVLFEGVVIDLYSENQDTVDIAFNRKVRNAIKHMLSVPLTGPIMIRIPNSETTIGRFGIVHNTIICVIRATTISPVEAYKETQT